MRRSILVRCGGFILAPVLLLSLRASGADRTVHEIQIVASRFMYEPSTIQVTAGEPVRLVVRSRDGSHGFSIPALKIDKHLPKTGEAVVVEFVAPPPGRFEIACSEFCGSGHSHMKAALVSVDAPSSR